MSDPTLHIDGAACACRAGASVAACLLEAGTSSFGRSVTGRTRAPICGMGICHECRVTVDGVAHVRACLTGARPGMRVETEGSPALLGSAPPPVRTIDVDVAVVGAGPAGIAAACRAAERGATVALLDGGTAPGGQIWRHGASPAPAPARRWLERFARTSARFVPGATVFDAEEIDDVFVLRAQGEDGLVRVTARALVLATGARELFLPYPGWTLPGVLGAAAAQALVKSGARFANRNAIVAGTGPILWAAAAALVSTGARVRVVAEQAPASAALRFARELWRTPLKLAAALHYRLLLHDSRFRTDTWVAAAEGTDHVRGVQLATHGRMSHEPCDLLCCAYGFVPNVELAQLLGCRIESGFVAVDDRQETSVVGVYAAGEPTGIGGADLALAEGKIAGIESARSVGRHRPSGARRVSELRLERAHARRFAARLDLAFRLRAELRSLATPETIVCRCEDVTLGKLANVRSAREAKLHTRAGMGPCQGRVCGAALRFLYGWDLDAPRSPVSPVPLALLAERSQG